MCAKCDETARIISEWTNKQGHERCWYYPDLFRRLAEIHGITPTVQPSLPSLPEFKEGCTRYQREEFDAVYTDDMQPPTDGINVKT